jgi:heme a synthase
MTTPAINRSSKPVAIWLLTGVGMIIIQILLGGITRLTGSGLSITEWNVVTGALPPLNEHQWLAEFEKYKQTPQFQLLNFDFTLSNFKFIFFWEWFHRFWARLILVVFAIPFIIFLVQRRFKPSMIKPMIILFCLGALQGAIGWIMVASGLTGDAIYVNPVKLALHFVFALGLLSYTFWFAMQVLIPKEKLTINPSLRKWIWTGLAFLVVQLMYGALMAGHKAATAAPTWPDINGEFIPSYIFHTPDGLMGVIENKITIQFIHRSIAYIIFILVMLWIVKAFRFKGSDLFNRTKWLPAVIVSIQVLLGILSVLTSLKIQAGHWGVFEWMAQLHQLVAILLLLSFVYMLYILRPASGKA